MIDNIRELAWFTFWLLMAVAGAGMLGGIAGVLIVLGMTGVIGGLLRTIFKKISAR